MRIGHDSTIKVSASIDQGMSQPSVGLGGSAKDCMDDILQPVEWIVGSIVSGQILEVPVDQGREIDHLQEVCSGVHCSVGHHFRISFELGQRVHSVLSPWLVPCNIFVQAIRCDHSR